MPWESRRGGRRYYVRSAHVGDHMVRQYVGSGPLAELAAAVDALLDFEAKERAAKEREREGRRTADPGQEANNPTNP